MARVDYEEQAARYDAGRALPDEAVAVWMVAARRHIGPAPSRVLDLGCGTGQWSGPLADVLDTNVVGLEPSAGMLARARTKRHPRVALARAKAEAIPLAQATCDAAWLSVVIHHFDDLPQAAKELRRVLKPGAPVLIRGAFPGRGPIGSLDRFFPGTSRVLDTYPALDETFDAFQAAGFGSLFVEKVAQMTAPNLQHTIERIRLRADTALLSLTDEEFETGLAALEEAAKHEHGPVFDNLELAVIR